MKHISYVVIIVISLIILPFLISSEPVVYEVSADYSIKLEKMETLVEDVKEEVVCSCIKTARASGVKIPYNTNAEDLVTNDTPHVGGLVLLDYEGVAHVAAIVSMTGEGMDVYEGNFRNPPNGCREGYRFIPWEDPAINGFWSPVDN